MKIFIICSKQFYSEVDNIKKKLECMNHEIYLPNCYDDPTCEARMKTIGVKEHQEFKAKMYKRSDEICKIVDAVLVLNFDKQKEGQIYKNYIGGATFLEMYDAFRNNKKIYLYNEIPEGMLYDEIEGFAPIIINGDLNRVK